MACSTIHHLPGRGPAVDNSKNRAASDPLAVMLEARSVALVGASPRPGSLGARMIEEVAKSPSRPRTYLVNPRYDEIGGTRCYPGLADLPEPVDLALLAVPDAALEEQVRAAAAAGARSAVIFGSAVDPAPADGRAGAGRGPPRRGAGPRPGLRERIAAIARDAGMAVCGAGCMGFVNVARGLRAIGYTEPDPLPAGPVALVTHSGSVFSALLRTRRAFGFTLAVSSGPGTRHPGRRLREVRAHPPGDEGPRARPRGHQGRRRRCGPCWPTPPPATSRSSCSRRAPRRRAAPWSPRTPAPWRPATAPGRPWRRPTASTASATWRNWPTPWSCSASPGGPPSPAVAGTSRVRRGRRPAGRGIATVHDSGFERAHVADVAAAVGVPFAPLGRGDEAAARGGPRPGPRTGQPARRLGDRPRPRGPVHRDAVGPGRRPRRRRGRARRRPRPRVRRRRLLPHGPARGRGEDRQAGHRPRLDPRRDRPGGRVQPARRGDPRPRVNPHGPAGPPPPPGPRDAVPQPTQPPHEPHECAIECAIATSMAHSCTPMPASRPRRPSQGNFGSGRRGTRLRAPLPLVGRARRGPAARRRPLRPAPRLRHPRRRGPLGRHRWTRPWRPRPSSATRSRSRPTPPASPTSPTWAASASASRVPAELAAAYEDLSARLGPRVTVTEMARPGPELILGMARDPALGPLIVVGAGGVLAEFLAERSVALPPLTREAPPRMLARLRVTETLSGLRGSPPVDLDAVIAAIVCVLNAGHGRGGPPVPPSTSTR